MSCLSDNGVLASYSRTSRKPMAVHPGNLILKKQTFQGFLPICMVRRTRLITRSWVGRAAFKEENPVWISEHIVSITWSDQIDLKIALEGHLASSYLTSRKAGLSRNTSVVHRSAQVMETRGRFRSAVVRVAVRFLRRPLQAAIRSVSFRRINADSRLDSEHSDFAGRLGPYGMVMPPSRLHGGVMPSVQLRPIYSSGKWEVDLTRRELRACGKFVPLGVSIGSQI
jgi:hypothetical protein